MKCFICHSRISKYALTLAVNGLMKKNMPVRKNPALHSWCNVKGGLSKYSWKLEVLVKFNV